MWDEQVMACSSVPHWHSSIGVKNPRDVIAKCTTTKKNVQGDSGAQIRLLEAISWEDVTIWSRLMLFEP